MPCGLFSFSESEETVSCKWDDSAADVVQLIECKSYKGKEPSLCFTVSLLILIPLFNIFCVVFVFSDNALYIHTHIHLEYLCSMLMYLSTGSES